MLECSGQGQTGGANCTVVSKRVWAAEDCPACLTRKHWQAKHPLEQMALSFGPSAFNSSVCIKYIIRSSEILYQGLTSEDI